MEFYIQTQEGKRRHIGWIWFRPSGTERGVVRKGVSISHWETTSEAAKTVERIHKYIDGIFTDALDVVENSDK